MRFVRSKVMGGARAGLMAEYRKSPLARPTPRLAGCCVGVCGDEKVSGWQARWGFGLGAIYGTPS